MTVTRFFEIARRGCVVRRAILFGAVVGTILVAINHGRCIAMGKFDAGCFASSTLTVVIPYLVSTISSVLAVGSGK